MIAASQEMHDEELKFTSLIKHLNKALAPRGIELKRVKWDPEVDGTINDYLVKLQKCEMCLTLYWKQLADNSEKVLQTAYDELKSGNNPRKIYVFFKEPSDDISESLKDFKENFVTNYGHFFCRFENADTINLHFILQFEAYQNTLGTDFVKISDGKVMIGDKEFANLDNIPFASMNKEYHRLQSELMQLDLRITELRQLFRANPENEDLEDKLMTAKSDRKKLADEFANYQQHLYDVALNFAKLSEERYTERIRKARELFESGYVVQADEILNLEEMKQEKENELKQFEQHRKNLELKIEEFCLKADTVLANTTLSAADRFKEACDALEQAIDITLKLNIDHKTLSSLYYRYGSILDRFHQQQNSISYYLKALELYRQLAITDPSTYLPKVAKVINRLALLHCFSYHYAEAEQYHKEALTIRRKLAQTDPDQHLKYLAETLNNLGILYSKMYLDSKSEKMYRESLDIYRALAEINPKEYLHDVAQTMNNLGILQYIFQHNYEESKKNLKQSLAIHRKMAVLNPKTYSENVARDLNNLANLHVKLHQYKYAEKNYLESLDIFQNLAEYDPETYVEMTPHLLYNLGQLQEKMSRYTNAESYYKESLAIYRKLVKTNPDYYLSKMVRPLTSLYLLHINLKQYPKALLYCQEALDINRELANTNPDPFLFDYADNLYEAAEILANLNNDKEAKKNYQEALILFERLDTSPSVNFSNIIEEIKQKISSLT